MRDLELQVREIGPANPADIARAVQFYNAGRNDEKTVGQWIWEYWTYHADQSVFVVAEDGDRIVGNQATIPIHLNLNGERRLTGKYENALLDPKYRGGDVYATLSAKAVALSRSKGMACIWGLTTASRVFRRAGFTIYEHIMEQPITVLSPWRALRAACGMPRPPLRKVASLGKILALSGYAVLARFVAELRSGPSAARRLSVERDLRSYEDVKALYARLREVYPGLIHLDLDAEYLEWRLFENPNLKSWAFWAYEGNSLVGYCLATLGDGEIALLSDVTFETEAAGIACLKGALAALKSEGCAYANCFGNRENPLIGRTLRLLARYGFVRRPPATFIAMNTSELDDSYFYEIRNWQVNGLWTEGYR